MDECHDEMFQLYLQDEWAKRGGPHPLNKVPFEEWPEHERQDWLQMEGSIEELIRRVQSGEKLKFDEPDPLWDRGCLFPEEIQEAEAEMDETLPEDSWARSVLKKKKRQSKKQKTSNLNMRGGYAPLTRAQAKGLSRDELFEACVRSIVERWTGLNLAVQNRWGGHDSEEKKERMIQQILEGFRAGEVDADELMTWLTEQMDTLFNTDMQDDSPAQVAAHMIIIQAQIASGNVKEALSLVSTSVESGVQRSQGAPSQTPGHGSEPSAAQEESSSSCFWADLDPQDKANWQVLGWDEASWNQVPRAALLLDCQPHLQFCGNGLSAPRGSSSLFEGRVST